MYLSRRYACIQTISGQWAPRLQDVDDQNDSSDLNDFMDLVDACVFGDVRDFIDVHDVGTKSWVSLTF